MLDVYYVTQTGKNPEFFDFVYNVKNNSSTWMEIGKKATRQLI